METPESNSEEIPSEKSNTEDRGFFNLAEDIGRKAGAAPKGAIETAAQTNKRSSAGSGGRCSRRPGTQLAT